MSVERGDSSDDVIWREFYARCQEVWEAYQKHGPGSVSDDVSLRFRSAVSRLESSSPESGFDSARLTQLLFRCIDRPEGLCFVSGEAGLIPRRDLYQEVEAALLDLAGLAKE